MALLLGVVADRLVGVDEAGGRVEAVVPAARVVAGDGDRALGERLGVVEELGQVDVGHAAHALAARAHAADNGVGLPFGLAIAALDGDRTGPADRGDVEGERLGRADVRLPEPAEEDAQHRVGVGGGADGGAGVAAHPLLVDDDRGRQAVEQVDVGPRQRRHEALHEGAVGLVDEPLRLGGDGGEDQRALAGTRDAGEDGQPALRDLDAHVLQVVLPGAVHPDQIVAVGRTHRATIAGPAARAGAQSDVPATNSLPAPMGEPFSLDLRTCWPEQEAVDGRWTSPASERAGRPAPQDSAGCAGAVCLSSDPVDALP